MIINVGVVESSTKTLDLRCTHVALTHVIDILTLMIVVDSGFVERESKNKGFGYRLEALSGRGQSPAGGLFFFNFNHCRVRALRPSLNI